MSEIEKLRSLLAEARRAVGDEECIDCGVGCQSVWGRIDAALAEPVGDALEWQTAITKALSESQERLAAEVREAIRERDEARAEVERLRNALAAISLDEYESTSSASEKVHGHARIARKALYGDKP